MGSDHEIWLWLGSWNQVTVRVRVRVRVRIRIRVGVRARVRPECHHPPESRSHDAGWPSCVLGSRSHDAGWRLFRSRSVDVKAGLSCLVSG